MGAAKWSHLSSCTNILFHPCLRVERLARTCSIDVIALLNQLWLFHFVLRQENFLPRSNAETSSQAKYSVLLTPQKSKPHSPPILDRNPQRFPPRFRSRIQIRLLPNRARPDPRPHSTRHEMRVRLSNQSAALFRLISSNPLFPRTPYILTKTSNPGIETREQEDIP